MARVFVAIRAGGYRAAVGDTQAGRARNAGGPNSRCWRFEESRRFAATTQTVRGSAEATEEDRFKGRKPFSRYSLPSVRIALRQGGVLDLADLQRLLGRQRKMRGVHGFMPNLNWGNA